MSSSAPGIPRNPSTAVVLAMAALAAASVGFAWFRGQTEPPVVSQASAGAPESRVGVPWEGPLLRLPREVEHDVWTRRRSGPELPARRRRTAASPRPDSGASADARKASAAPAAPDSQARLPALSVEVASTAAPAFRVRLPREDWEWSWRPGMSLPAGPLDARTRRAFVAESQAPAAAKADPAPAPPRSRTPETPAPPVALPRGDAPAIATSAVPVPAVPARRITPRSAKALDRPRIASPVSPVSSKRPVPTVSRPSERVLGKVRDLEELRLRDKHDLHVDTDGELGGSGIVPGSLVVSGIFAPGHSPGVVQVEGDFALEPDAVLEIELAGTAAEDFDRIVVEGSATLSGVVRVLLLDGFIPQLGDSFEVLLAQAIEDAGASFELPDLGPDRFLQLSLLTTDAGQSLVLSSMVAIGAAGSVVPEPGPALLLAAGLVGLAVRGRLSR